MCMILGRVMVGAGLRGMVLMIMMITRLPVVYIFLAEKRNVAEFFGTKQSEETESNKENLSNNINLCINSGKCESML